MIYFPLSISLNLALSWFIGCSSIVLAYIFLFFIGFEINYSNILLIIFVFLVTFKIFLFKKKQNKILNKNYLKILYSLVISFAILYFVYFFFSGIIVQTPDSLQYHVLSKYLNHVIQYDYKSVAHIWDSFDKRLIFLPALNNFGNLLGLSFLDIFIPTNSIFFMILFLNILLYFFDFQNIKKNKLTLFFCFVALMTLITNKVYIQHSFYFHTNFLTMVYFTLGVMGVAVYIRDYNTNVLLFGIFFLALTILIRKEMLLFSLIPLIYLNYKNLLPNFKYKVFIFAIYFFVGFLYRLLLVFLFFLNEKYLSLSFSSHGGHVVVILMLLSLIILVFMRPFDLFPKKNRFLFIISILLLFLIILYFKSSKDTVDTLNALMNLLKKKYWGNIWLITFATLCLFYLNELINKKLNFSNQLIKKNNIAIVDFLGFVVSIFFVLRVYLYILYGSIADKFFYDSGNRILITVFPISIILTFLILHFKINLEFKKFFVICKKSIINIKY